MTSQTVLKPGDKFRIRRGPITTTQLVKYAGASGDFNRIHFDHPFAMQVGLGGLVAHGMLTMGFAASCLSEAAGPQVFLKEVSARFTAPVRVGDVVDVEATVTGVDPSGAAAVEIEARVGDKTVLKGKAVALVGREGAAPLAAA